MAQVSVGLLCCLRRHPEFSCLCTCRTPDSLFDLFSATLHEIRHQLLLFPDHKIFVGVDANVKLAGCSDGFLIGDAVLRADSSCLDRQRTGAFVEFLQDCRRMVCNTWTREVLSTRRECLLSNSMSQLAPKRSVISFCSLLALIVLKLRS